MKNRFMTLTSYEMFYILKPNVTEATNLNLVNHYRALIKKKGGKNISIQHRGRRHLSYNVLHYYDGIYVQLNYHGNGDLVQMIERHMRLNDNVLRYLTLKN